MSVFRVPGFGRRKRSGRARRVRPTGEVGETARTAWADRVLSDLAQELPDEDIGEDLDDTLDFYRKGSKPPGEEDEYLSLVEDARDRLESGY